MPEELHNEIEESMRRRFNLGKKVDPTSFNDPIALKTQWNSLTRTRGGITSHRLVSVHKERAEFKHTIFFKVMMFTIGAIVGLVLLIIGGFLIIGDIIPFVLLVFVPLTGMAAASIRSPIVFDKQVGFFWKGRTSPAHVVDITTIKHYAHIKDIHALQLVRTGDGSGSPAYNYEINLVLHTGERLHVIYYASKNKFHKDAAVLARFLGVPVWDASDCWAPGSALQKSIHKAIVKEENSQSSSS